MKFNPQNFKRLEGGSKPATSIRLMDESTMILIKENGDARYGRTRTDKDAIVRDFDEATDLLLWAWTGQYHTDIFLLTKNDLDQFYRSS